MDPPPSLVTSLQYSYYIRCGEFRSTAAVKDHAFYAHSPRKIPVPDLVMALGEALGSHDFAMFATFPKVCVFLFGSPL